MTKSQQLSRLKERLAEMQKKPIVIDWLRFDVLPGAEKARHVQAWTEYYRRCMKTRAYEIYQAQKAILARLPRLKGQDLSEAKQLLQANGAIAREMLANEDAESIQRPVFRDPYEFWHGDDVKSYQALCKKIENLSEGDSLRSNVEAYLS